MKTRQLGQQGLMVSAIGLGCMGMSWAYGATDEQESLKAFERALELGVNFWDTAEVYGPLENERLLGKMLKRVPRDKVIIATKFGFKFGHEGINITGVTSSPAHIKKSIEGSLQRLGIDYIDLYYQHRLDPQTSIEDTVQAMADLVKEGKVRYLGLSEVGPTILRRAHQVHPISALQSEYSLWERGIESMLPVVQELGIGLVPYSPLGRGFLAGRWGSTEELDADDWRRNVPRLEDTNLRHNLMLVQELNKLGSQFSATPAQVALAWLLRQGPMIVPIPGTKRVKYVEENARAVDLVISEAAWAKMDAVIKGFKTKGARMPEEMMGMIDRS